MRTGKSRKKKRTALPGLPVGAVRLFSGGGNWII